MVVAAAVVILPVPVDPVARVRVTIAWEIACWVLAKEPPCLATSVKMLLETHIETSALSVLAKEAPFPGTCVGKLEAAEIGTAAWKALAEANLVLETRVRELQGNEA